ncbi:hypothetical protein [Acrocarpospora macrocephala]|nr:hypothetical protein [Acrocarpospora macrocephala]
MTHLPTTDDHPLIQWNPLIRLLATDNHPLIQHGPHTWIPR